MNTPFDPIDKESLSKVLSSPPFITVDGVLNIREVGGFPIIAVNNVLVKPGYYFRASDPSKITDKGKEQLRTFGIMKIFDFRGTKEIKAPLLSMEGVKVIPVKIEDDTPSDPMHIIYE